MGVLIDDLVTRGVSEPYRMFTSRAEYRLMLREDNADLRLTEAGRRLGIVDDHRWRTYAKKRELIERERSRLDSIKAGPETGLGKMQEKILGRKLDSEYTLTQILRRPEANYLSLKMIHEDFEPILDAAIAEQVEIQIKYQGYIDRQKQEVARAHAQGSMRIPDDIDYAAVSGLSSEVRQKLQRHRPETIGQASRISGLTPAAISLLLVHLKRRDREKSRAA